MLNELYDLIIFIIIYEILMHTNVCIERVADSIVPRLFSMFP